VHYYRRMQRTPHLRYASPAGTKDGLPGCGGTVRSQNKSMQHIKLSLRGRCEGGLAGLIVDTIDSFTGKCSCGGEFSKTTHARRPPEVLLVSFTDRVHGDKISELRAPIAENLRLPLSLLGDTAHYELRSVIGLCPRDLANPLKAHAHYYSLQHTTAGWFHCNDKETRRSNSHAVLAARDKPCARGSTEGS
jgi:hypothetical protein